MLRCYRLLSLISLALILRSDHIVVYASSLMCLTAAVVTHHIHCAQQPDFPLPQNAVQCIHPCTCPLQSYVRISLEYMSRSGVAESWGVRILTWTKSCRIKSRLSRMENPSIHPQWHRRFASAPTSLPIFVLTIIYFILFIPGLVFSLLKSMYP